MEAAWFALVALLFSTYVVLDGFDLGAGAVHLAVARTDGERRTVLAAIAPLWDGNEVWLIAGGGTLFFAFPKAYAVAFSGFYLPLMILLWLVVLRGLSIELRSHLENALWREFWDGVFALSSGAIALVLGAAFGNLVRGVPIDGSGYFRGELFTDFRVGGSPGALDWYTALVGAFATLALSLHGALYLAWKTAGPVAVRSGEVARYLLPVVGGVGLLVTGATALVAPGLFAHLASRPWAWPLSLLGLGGLVLAIVATVRGRALYAFVGSAAMLTGLLASTAAGLYPTLLRSTVDAAYNLDATDAATGRRGLELGLWWWVPAVLLAAGYFVYLLRSFAGKVRASEKEESP